MKYTIKFADGTIIKTKDQEKAFAAFFAEARGIRKKDRNNFFELCSNLTAKWDNEMIPYGDLFDFAATKIINHSSYDSIDELLLEFINLTGCYGAYSEDDYDN